mgnify:CR=1 FL=1|jgi:hypothetical protein
MLKKDFERPVLDKNISLGTFKSYYWLKSELQVFCKINNLKISGSKETVRKRVSDFLNVDKTEIIEDKKNKIKLRTASALISIEQKIGTNFKFGRESREFFKKHCDPKFSFNIEFMEWVKENPNKTLDHAIKEWELIIERKKDPAYTTNIGSQFEYNQYTRDFFHYKKKNNLKLSKKDCIKCWNFKKTIPNHFSSKRIVFEPNDLSILCLKVSESSA